MSKKNKLTEEEKDILSSVEKEEWESVSDIKLEKKRALKMATNTLKKDARINIRLSTPDLERIKRQAAYEGLPYQTLIASILHKYAAGHFKKTGTGDK